MALPLAAAPWLFHHVLKTALYQLKAFEMDGGRWVAPFEFWLEHASLLCLVAAQLWHGGRQHQIDFSPSALRIERKLSGSVIPTTLNRGMFPWTISTSAIPA